MHRLNDEASRTPRSARRVVLHWAADHCYVIGQGGRRRTAGAGGNGDGSSLVAQTEGA